MLTAAEVAERSGRAWAVSRGLVAAVPVWLWVGALVCVSSGIRFVIARSYPGPWIFHDEIAYSELGRSLGRTGSFAIRNVPGTNGFGFVYPALISPAYALFDHVPAAYHAAKAINAVVMSLVAVPTYLLARRLLRPALAFFAAVLTLAVPSMTYTTTLMTENAFYPAFMLTALLIYLAFERPTIVRQLLVFPAILLTFFTRAQGVMLVPALLTGIVLLALLDAWLEPGGSFVTRLRARLTPYWVSFAAVGAAAILVVVYEHARGRPLNTFLGSYGGVTLFHYHLRPIVRWLFYNVGELDLYMGLLPFAAFIYVTTGLLRSERSRALRAFTAMSVPIVVWFAWTVSAFAAIPITGERIEERNFFYVIPLFFIALLVWVDRGLPRKSLAAAASVVAAVALTGAVPYESIINSLAVTGTFGLLPLMRLEQRGFGPHSLPELVAVCALAAGLFLLLVPRRLALALPALVLVYLALISSPIRGITRQASLDSARAGITVQRDWIDRAVGSNANVALLYFGQQVPVWQNEFFNASARSIYNVDGDIDGLPDIKLVVNPTTGLITDPYGQTPARAQYVLANRASTLRGHLVAEDGGTGMQLYRTAGIDLQLAQTSTGIYPDTWSGSTVTYRRYACTGGTLAVSLASDRSLHPGKEQVVATDQGGHVLARQTLAPAQAAGEQMVVPLRGEGGVCNVTFTISPTAVPAQTFGGADTRELGLYFRGFAYKSPR